MASKSKTDPQPGTAAATFPLFYAEPQALTAEAHGALRLKNGQDFRFAAGTNAVPIMAAEFVEGQRAYPIVFVGEPAHPAVVLGLAEENLYLEADGGWAEGRYIPAYVRRYPFVFIETADKTQYALGIDVACSRLAATPGDGEGQALFVDGQPSPLTQEALRFSAALQASQQDTRAFCDALVERDLLVEQQAQGALADGEPFNVRGFRTVDAARLHALPDEVVLDWRRKGWLTLIDFHLASLSLWRDLLGRQGAAVKAP